MDLAPVDSNDEEAGWAMFPWEASMMSRASAHHTSYSEQAPHPVLGEGANIMGDAAKRQTFVCMGCGATPTFQNITLLRLVLAAIASGERSVRLAPLAKRGDAPDP